MLFCVLFRTHGIVYKNNSHNIGAGMSQNIYDNERFFEQYISLRRGKNYNDLLEQPAMKRLLPEVKGKRILDIGCGYGANSLSFAQMGAEYVLGIDISKKMLDMAKSQYCHAHVEYRCLDMSQISEISCKFDFIYSSLAFHYAENFSKLIHDCYGLLRNGGYLLFSQEHPIVTAAYDSEGYFHRGTNGEYLSYTFSHYGESGKRTGTWFVEGVESYHRTMGEIVTALGREGFILEELVEPLPAQEALQVKPDLIKEFVRPTFLIIRAKKRNENE